MCAQVWQQKLGHAFDMTTKHAKPLCACLGLSLAWCSAHPCTVSAAMRRLALDRWSHSGLGKPGW